MSTELTDDEKDLLQSRGWYYDPSQEIWVDLGTTAVERFDTKCRGCDKVTETYLSMAGMCYQCSILKNEHPGYPPVDALSEPHRYIYHLIMEEMHQGKSTAWKVDILLGLLNTIKGGDSAAARIMSDA